MSEVPAQYDAGEMTVPELIQALEYGHNERFESVERGIADLKADHAKRFDAIDQRLDRLEGKLDRLIDVEQKLDELLRRGS